MYYKIKSKMECIFVEFWVTIMTQNAIQLGRKTYVKQSLYR